MNLTIWIYTKLFGKCRGEDQFGNRYYESKRFHRDFNRNDRWVYYKGIPEPSKIPPVWYGWLHYQSDEVPQKDKKLYKWEKEKVPNLTGTEFAYYPSGHVLGDGKRRKATGDYEAWKPNQ
ncbi:NADH:ubiquinone oxidoreductase subunit NDUFA12 [Holosporaceae bacterium 'Namur']|nr:NADH:ubiquinone oxidoreductase subunit NDUFA12 [Holosporaceae bacterium 'Namur']